VYRPARADKVNIPSKHHGSPGAGEGGGGGGGREGGCGGWGREGACPVIPLLRAKGCEKREGMDVRRN